MNLKRECVKKSYKGVAIQAVKCFIFFWVISYLGSWIVGGYSQVISIAYCMVAMFTATRNIEKKTPRSAKTLKASTVMNGPLERIIDLLTSEYSRKKYDKLHKNIQIQSKTDGSSFSFKFTEDLSIKVNGQISPHLPKDVYNLPDVKMRF